MKSPAILMLVILALQFFAACRPNQPGKNVITDSSGNSTAPLTAVDAAMQTDANPYFKASGTEPFWGLTISSHAIRFNSINEYNDSFMSPHSMPVAAADANIKIYKLQTGAGNMEIEVSQALCINAMSGDSSPYKVTITLTKENSAGQIKFEGCGRYITDSLLNGRWKLEELENKIAEDKDFDTEIPYLNITTNNNSVNAYAGCNQLNGTIFFEQGILRFTKVRTTRKMCAGNNKENLFLKALNSSVNYKIENDRLTISNPSGIQAIFKKE
jgi:heat shock protein HslJ